MEIAFPRLRASVLSPEGASRGQLLWHEKRGSRCVKAEFGSVGGGAGFAFGGSGTCGVLSVGSIGS